MSVTNKIESTVLTNRQGTVRTVSWSSFGVMRGGGVGWGVEGLNINVPISTEGSGTATTGP